MEKATLGQKTSAVKSVHAVVRFKAALKAYHHVITPRVEPKTLEISRKPPVSTAYRMAIAREIVCSLTGELMGIHDDGNGAYWPTPFRGAQFAGN